MSATQEVGDIFGEGKGPAQAMLRSPTVLIVSVGLWGMDVFFFNLFGINYRYVLNYDLMKEQQAHQQQRQQLLEEDAEANSVNSSQAAEPDKQDAFEDEEEFYSPAKQTTDAKAITWCKLVLFSLILLVMLHLTTHLWIDKLGRGMIGAIFSFYGVVLVYIFLPISSNQWLRRAFVITLRRSFELIKPRCTKDTLRPIPFVDVFFADAMCSLSKVFFDWGMLLHMASHYPEPVPNSMHNILIPSACAAVPYLIRARQCVIMLQIGQLKNDPTRYQHLANAIKYSTSIWPLLLSAYQKTIDPAQAKKMEGLLIFLLTYVQCSVGYI